MPKTFYITTAIDYTNAPPHIGHAYEKVLADVLARYHRLKGEDVYFLTGVDQHGQKVQQTAEKRGVTPAEHASEMTEKFKAIWARLGIKYDGWAETTSELHKNCVQKILLDLHEKGQLYKKSYCGHYSVRQEQFLTDKERGEDGKFGEEWGEVVEIEEENWYFRLSEHVVWMKEFVENAPNFVIPSFRKPEILNTIERSFGTDLCISRPKKRLHWGIEIPFDTDFVTYVWFDALINYISFAGYLSDKSCQVPDFQKLWPADLHIIGKDILLPSHSIYWPAMLHAMGFGAENMPCLLVHGWWNLKGEKMSKSLGNVIDPDNLVNLFGVDAVRYYLVRDISTGKDSDFDVDRLMMIYNSELANDLGNLCNRSLNMSKRYRESQVMPTDYDDSECENLRASLSASVSQYIQAMDEYRVSDALQALSNHVSTCNGFIEKTQPWALAKNPEAENQLSAVLSHLIESCAQISVMISPVLPEAAKRIQDQLNVACIVANLSPAKLAWGLVPTGHQLNDPAPVFPRIQKLEEVEK